MFCSYMWYINTIIVNFNGVDKDDIEMHLLNFEEKLSTNIFVEKL